MEQTKRANLVMVCGPNGAGKSTFTATSDTSSLYPVVDADKVAKDSGLGPIDAGKKVYSQIKEYLDNKQSFARESTLTSKFDFKLMEQARQQGYYVSMVYVGLKSVQQSLDRVAHRHTLGGHDVPKDDLVRRYSRSIDNLPRAIKLADEVMIYDNSDKREVEVAYFEKGVLKNEYSTPNWYLEVKKNLGLEGRQQEGEVQKNKILSEVLESERVEKALYATQQYDTSFNKYLMAENVKQQQYLAKVDNLDKSIQAKQDVIKTYNSYKKPGVFSSKARSQAWKARCENLPKAEKELEQLVSELKSEKEKEKGILRSNDVLEKDFRKLNPQLTKDRDAEVIRKQNEEEREKEKKRQEKINQKKEKDNPNDRGPNNRGGGRTRKI